MPLRTGSFLLIMSIMGYMMVMITTALIIALKISKYGAEWAGWNNAR